MIEEGGALPLYGHTIYSLIVFAYRHIPMYARQRLKEVHNGLMSFSEDRKIINLLESFPTSIQSVLCQLYQVFQPVNVSYTLSENGLKGLPVIIKYCSFILSHSESMRNQMKEFLLILIIFNCLHSFHMLFGIE